jgi:Tfp pilus assembly protein PilO
VKPVRRSAPRSATAGRSGGNRAVMALAIMGALVVLYGWNSFFMAPKAKAKAEVSKELTAARKQEEDLRRNLAELSKLANDTKAREAELSRLGRLIPPDPDVDGAILALNEAAHQAQVAWSSFLPAPPAAAAGGPTSISISMHVAGNFGQIFDYLRRLESLDRIVVVDSIQLSAAPNGAGSPKIDADIKARMFSAAAASPLASATVAAVTTASPSDTTALPKAGG